MKSLRWLWIAAVLILGMLISTSVGWVMTLIVVLCLYEPLWDRVAGSGRPSLNHQRKITAIVLSVLMVFGSWSMASHREMMEDTNKTLAESEELLKSIDAQYPRDNVNQKWEYASTVDPLTDKRIETACIASRDTARLNSPYEATRARLCLRNSPQHGRDVFVALEKDGQILCEYSGCQVRVRFDKNNVRSMAAGGADDNASNIIFIADRKSIERGIKGAQQMIVQLQFYQAGNQPLTFDVKGLAWPKS
ncbi:hypothetical protein U1701_04280 [Sphingomonas sp. PB2P19]|uniref:hypothetical protein n=1 Tax=Sphingomonas rhamnosi TaxID=3096156 RepID=UPI002FC9D0AC